MIEKFKNTHEIIGQSKSPKREVNPNNLGWHWKILIIKAVNTTHFYNPMLKNQKMNILKVS